LKFYYFKPALKPIFIGISPSAPKTFKLRVNCEDFCASARKVRRSLPKGKQGGLDAAIAQKDRKAHAI